MKVRFSARARRDLEAIYRYVSDHNPTAARAIVERIEEVASALEQHPSLGHRTRIPGVRVFTVPGLPYRVSYSLGPHEITILTVRRRPVRGLQ